MDEEEEEEEMQRAHHVRTDSSINYHPSQLKKERGSLVNKADQPPFFLHHLHQSWEVKWCGAGPCRLSWNVVGRILSGGDDWLMGQWCPTSDQYGLRVGSFLFSDSISIGRLQPQGKLSYICAHDDWSSWVTFSFHFSFYFL